MHRSTFLMAAFAALLGVIALASWGVWRNARSVQRQTEAIYAADLMAQEQLESVRAGLYSVAILTRDYLLSPGVATKVDYEDQFIEIRHKTEGALAKLETLLHDDVSAAALRHMREELEAYWATTQVMFDWTAQERSERSVQMLRERMLRRQQIVALTERLAQLTSQTSTQERERTEAADREFQTSLAWIGGLALLLGAGISAFTLIRMKSLEQQSRAAEADLRSLSVQIRTAQEEERKYLSRELHDQVGQLLTGLRMELTAAARLNSPNESEISARLARAKGTVEQTLGIVRDIAMLLRPSMLDDLGLTPALNWLVKDLSRSSGLDIRSEIDSSVDHLPEAHCTCLYRVVQEALTNAIRHSGAAAVELKVAAEDGWVRATITDNGKGFEAGQGRRKGLGLLGMEERVRELGGTLEVTSAPGRGATLEVRLPRPPQGDSIHESVDSGRSRDRSDRLKVAP